MKLIEMVEHKIKTKVCGKIYLTLHYTAFSGPRAG
jgi:hypothetical protein